MLNIEGMKLFVMIEVKTQDTESLNLSLTNCSMDVAVACYLHSTHGRLRDAYRGDKGWSKNLLSAFFFLLFLLIHIFIPHSFHFLFSSPLVCKGVAVTSGGHLVWVTSAAQTCFRMPHKTLWHHVLSKEFLKRKHCLQAAYLNHKPCKNPDTYHKNHARVRTRCRRIGDYGFGGRKDKLFFFLIVFGVQQNFPRDLFKRF